MPITKKDSLSIADAIIEHNARAKSGMVEPFSQSQLEAVASGLKTTNALFQKDRWLDYIKGKCGPNGGSIKKATK